MNIFSLKDIINLDFQINLPSIIFLRWDLWSWKTTLTKHIINNLLWVKDNITSPTYVYYNKFIWDFKNTKLEKTNQESFTIYHFDLYRLSSYQEFTMIWGEEILDNNSWIIIIEWPELIENYYKADLDITINKTLKDDERELKIIKR